MNKAINRDELLRVLYKGRARPMYVHGFTLTSPVGIPPGEAFPGDVRL